MQPTVNPDIRAFGTLTKAWMILLLATFTYILVNDWLALAQIKALPDPKMTSFTALLEIIVGIDIAYVISIFILLVSRKEFAFWILIFLGFASFSINLRLDIPLLECTIGLSGTLITWLLLRNHWKVKN